MTKFEKGQLALCAVFYLGFLQLGYLAVCDGFEKDPWWRKKPGKGLVFGKKYAEVKRKEAL